MNTQECYEAIREYFSKPDAVLAKINPFSSRACFYRMQQMDGTVAKCAIGCILPDELYKEDMENKSVSKLYNQYPRLREYFKDIDKNFLVEAQGAHDSSVIMTPDQFIYRLDLIAKVFDLKVV